MKKEVHIGCSSYNNRYWKGIFYPDGLPSAKWFDFYCGQFGTYEMNGTFYKFPTLRVMANWYNKAPQGFMFSVKAPKEITHIKRLNDCAQRLAEFYGVCREGLKEKLGYILFQFPPSYHYTPQKLEQITGALQKGFRNVVEFRHESWWIPQVVETLAAYGIIFCSVSYPKLPTTIFTDNSVVYIRLHGTPKLFSSAYSKDELSVLQQIISNTVTPQTIIVYFNNTASAAGIENALQMKKLFEKAV